MDWAGFGGLLLGVAAIATVVITLRQNHRKDKAERIKTNEVQRQDIQTFISAQTEMLLGGYQGVFNEYKNQARELADELKASVKQNASMQVRIHMLEESDAKCQRLVAELQQQVASMKRTIAELSEQR